MELKYTVAGQLRRHAAERPDDVVFVDGSVRQTWAEHYERAGRVANVLLAEGLVAGDRVAFLDHNSLAFFEVASGAALAGMITVSINWRLAPPEMEAVIEDAGATVLRAPRRLPRPPGRMAGGTPGGTAGGGAERPAGDDRQAGYEKWQALTLRRPRARACRRRGGHAAVHLWHHRPAQGGHAHQRLREPLHRGERPGHFEMTGDSVSLVAMPIFHISGAGWGLASYLPGGRAVILRDRRPGRDPAPGARRGGDHHVRGAGGAHGAAGPPRRGDDRHVLDGHLFYGASPIAEDASPIETVAAAQAPGTSAAQAPVLFKAIGYVEKADGKLEAIIMQENEVQVVHVGDDVEGRYRVTKITPEMVSAVDETVIQVPMTGPEGVEKNAKPSSPNVLAENSPPEPSVTSVRKVNPPPAGILAQSTPVAPPVENSPSSLNVSPNTDQHAENSLGYVEKADGKVESVVADGDSVRLVPEAPTMAQVNIPPSRPSAEPAAQASADTKIAPELEMHPNTLGVIASVAPIAMADPQMSAFRHHDSMSPTPAAEKSTAAEIIPATNHPSTNSARPEGTAQPSVPMEPTQANPEISPGSNPLGYVEDANGKLAVILGQGDGVRIVWEGNQAAERLGDVIAPPNQESQEARLRNLLPPPFTNFPQLNALQRGSAEPAVNASAPGSLEASTPGNPEVLPPGGPAKEDPPVQPYSSTAGPVEAARREAYNRRESLPTFIFQTLGYVESPSGEVQAIVADGPDTYFVKQGEVFADEYRATSVDPYFVLAVKVPEARPLPDFLSAHTDFQAKLASNRLQSLRTQESQKALAS